ncbi:MAG: hypothetical protein U0Q55_00065 [Vicinamibacterales bacterium]
MFNELVVARMATAIGLPWPAARVGRLSMNDLSAADRVSIGDTYDAVVCLEYLPDLIAIPQPPGSDYGSAAWNSGPLLQQFQCARAPSAFYGRHVIEIWANLEDCKFDTLHKRRDGSPVFLDGGAAFGYVPGGGGASTISSVASYSPRSPYLPGVLNDPTAYDEWLERVATLGESEAAGLTCGIPSDWGVPAELVAEVEQFVTFRRDEFVHNFREYGLS